ncbi:MAG: hypothetical protein JW733_01650 [Coriobacteriia bacterium]|nr:hypothetical protein [Coriobacteriia bacterium]MBN2847498.1 hypothetical protein [Coriobacteriia bacterium]
MTDSDHTRRMLIVIAVVSAALVVLAIVWMLRPGSMTESGTTETADTGESTVAASAADVETMPDTAAAESTAPETETAPAADAPTTAETPAPSERVPALVVSVRIEDGATILTVDYIQFLTGDEASAAAADRGDESPPPNDYYIVNDNTRLREFTVQDGISVLTVVQDDGTSDPGGHLLPLNDWVTRLSGPAGDAFRSSFYWLTVSGETITTVEQQYLP